MRFILILLFLFVGNFNVFACTPCAQMYDLKQTIQKADLIVLAVKTDKGPSTGRGPGFGPDWIKVRILNTLKGKADQKNIKVNSWDGFCEYGINIGEQQHILFLIEEKSLLGSIEYDAVNLGCAVKDFLLINETIELQDKTISLEEFQVMINETINP